MEIHTAKNTVTFLIKTLGPSMFYYHQIEKPLPHRSDYPQQAVKGDGWWKENGSKRKQIKCYKQIGTSHSRGEEEK